MRAHLPETSDRAAPLARRPIAKNSALQTFADDSPAAQRLGTFQQMADTRGPIQRTEDEDLRQDKPIQRVEGAARPNNTGMPDSLKSGVETLSGVSMDHVKVHYNSDKPAAVQAHAYAQGSQIHLGPGQERHLPHEAWHVVQQAQGRVKPTMQLKGIGVNDDAALEKEADVMGAKALTQPSDAVMTGVAYQRQLDGTVIQCGGGEKALLVLGGALSGALIGAVGSWLYRNYEAADAERRKAQIIHEFEAAIASAGYVDNATTRENQFVLTSLRAGVSEDVARDLFAASGAAAKDVVTGFDVAADRKPSIASAISFIQANDAATGYYVEVDIRNLGGLNGVLGHEGADTVFKAMSDIAAKHATGLAGGKNKVARFRHGGDEFSFLVVSEDGSIDIGAVNDALEAARIEILEFTASKKVGDYNEAAEAPDVNISAIVHPKHKGDESYYGTGIIFGTSQITGGDEVGSVVSAADLQVEQKKA